MKIKRNAFHETAARFGPCVGPMTPELGESWFCKGYGTERIDPAADTFAEADVILCYPCFSMREAKVIQNSVMEVLSA